MCYKHNNCCWRVYFKSTATIHKGIVHDHVFLELLLAQELRMKFLKAGMALKPLCQPRIKPTPNFNHLKVSYNDHKVRTYSYLLLCRQEPNNLWTLISFSANGLKKGSSQKVSWLLSKMFSNQYMLGQSTHTLQGHAQDWAYSMTAKMKNINYGTFLWGLTSITWTKQD